MSAVAGDRKRSRQNAVFVRHCFILDHFGQVDDPSCLGAKPDGRVDGVPGGIAGMNSLVCDGHPCKWADGVLQRKGEARKFITEFQSTFDSSMWELYLNRALIDLGCTVDYSKSAPDFCVTGPGGYEFNIEAVISGKAPGAGPQNTFDEQAFKRRGAVKLAGKLRDKLKLYRGSDGKKHLYASMSHVRNRPFVIAIAPFDSDFSLFQNNELINMVLFGLAPPVLQGPDRGRQDKISFLPSALGAPVPMGIFTNDSYKEISAVFFSTVGTFGKAVVESKVDSLVRATRYRRIHKDKIDQGSKLWQLGESHFELGPLRYLKTIRFAGGDEIGGSDITIQRSSYHHETHLDGLQVYFNPYAEVPFDRNFAWPAEVALNYWDVARGEHFQAHPDNALVSRQVFGLAPHFVLQLLANNGFIRPK